MFLCRNNRESTDSDKKIEQLLPLAHVIWCVRQILYNFTVVQYLVFFPLIHNTQTEFVSAESVDSGCIAVHTDLQPGNGMYGSNGYSISYTVKTFM